MRTKSLLRGIATLAAFAGCLTNPLDPSKPGVFVCVDTSECPSGQECLQGFCETAPLPSLEILSPEEAQPFEFVDANSQLDLELSVRVDNMQIIAQAAVPADEARPGIGWVKVEVDGEEIDPIEEGADVVEIPITVDNTPGVHRIRVTAMLHDGTPYDNEACEDDVCVGAVATRIFWINDLGIHVAIRDPWPGDTFDLTQQLIEVEVAAINEQIGTPLVDPEIRHVHMFYDIDGETDLIDCLATGCSNDYVGIVPSVEDPKGPMQLPPAVVGPVPIMAVMVNYDHSLFQADDPVFDQIEIFRAE